MVKVLGLAANGASVRAIIMVVSEGNIVPSRPGLAPGLGWLPYSNLLVRVARVVTSRSQRNFDLLQDRLF